MDKEAVNHPAHYNHGKYEAIDIIEDWSLGFNLGNAFKYIYRSGHKQKPAEDLEKAIWYLEREKNTRAELHDKRNKRITKMSLPNMNKKIDIETVAVDSYISQHLIWSLSVIYHVAHDLSRHTQLFDECVIEIKKHIKRTKNDR